MSVVRSINTVYCIFTRGGNNYCRMIVNLIIIKKLGNLTKLFVWSVLFGRGYLRRFFYKAAASLKA